MKLKYQFEIVEMPDEVCAVPVGDNAEEFHAVLQLNEVAAKMLTYLGECDTPEEVHQRLCADFPSDDKAEIGRQLCDFLNMLTKEGLLLP